MNGADDEMASDAATGLPPLVELGTDPALLVLAWGTGTGIVANDYLKSDEPCRFLHVRGLMAPEKDSGLAQDGYQAQWAQLHIAIPMSLLGQLAVDLLKGWDV